MSTRVKVAGWLRNLAGATGSLLLIACVGERGEGAWSGRQLPVEPPVSDLRVQAPSQARSRASDSLAVVKSDARGKIEKGSGESEAVDEGRVSAGAPGERSVDGVRQSLLRYGAKSKRGPRSIELSLQVLDALEAGSSEARHARLAMIPVTIETVAVVSQDGRAGMRRDYLLSGVRKLSIVRYVSADQEFESSEAQPESLSGGPSAEDASHAGWPTTPSLPGVTLGLFNCSYTDPDNVFWSGPCATQQEIDDGVVAALALESDIEGIQSEVSGDSSSYCAFNPSDYQYCAAQWALGVEPAKGARLSGPSAMPGGPFAIPESDHCSDGSTLSSCADNGIAYAAAVGTFAWRLFRLNTVLRAVAPPAGAIADGVITSVFAAGAVVGTAIALHDCLAE